MLELDFSQDIFPKVQKTQSKQLGLFGWSAAIGTFFFLVVFSWSGGWSNATWTIPGFMVWMSLVILGIYKQTIASKTHRITWRDYGWCPVLATVLCLLNCWTPSGDDLEIGALAGSCLWDLFYLSVCCKLIGQLLKTRSIKLFNKSPVPTIILFIISLIAISPLPKIPALAISEPALNNYVGGRTGTINQKIQDCTQGGKPIYIGLIPVYGCFSNGSATYLITSSAMTESTTYASGLVYTRDISTPPNDSCISWGPQLWPNWKTFGWGKYRNQ